MYRWVKTFRETKNFLRKCLVYKPPPLTFASKLKRICMAESMEVKPIGVGEFGEIYDQFKGDVQGAIAFLLNKKSGEAIGALYHKEIGDIDLVWGEEGTGKSDGYGLAKLVKFHPEVLNDLQSIVGDMIIEVRTSQRIQLGSERYHATVRLTWNDIEKTWLLTAFEKKNSVSDNTTDTVGTPKEPGE